MCSTTLLGFFFVGVFSITAFDVSLIGIFRAFASLEGFGGLWLIHSASPGALDWRVLGVL